MTDEVKQAAAEGGDPFFADAVIEGTHVLQLVVPVGDGYALQLVRPLEEVDRLLDRIGIVLILVSLGGIAAAAAFGALVARTALRPVTQLTREAEVVAETRDLSHRIGLEGNDELARLGASFDTMLAALDESQRQQRQLVADASHELGTPLTSIRTNVEVLARRNDLAPEAREALLGDLVGQLGEMSGLVTGLVELASEAPTELEVGDVQLDELVEDAVSRAARLAPQITFTSELEPTVVRGVPGRLERAVSNVLDNAVKWSEPGATVEVAVQHGAVTVRDHGPGIARGGRPAHLRPLLPLGPGAGDARLGARARNRQARRRRARRHRHRLTCGRRRHHRAPRLSRDRPGRLTSGGARRERALDEPLQPVRDPLEERVGTLLRQSLARDRLREPLLHGRDHGGDEAVDALAARPGDLGERLALAQLGAERLTRHAEVLGCRAAALRALGEAIAERLALLGESAPRAEPEPVRLRDPRLQASALRGSQLPCGDGGVHAGDERGLERRTQLLG